MKPILPLLTLTWLVCPLPWSYAQLAASATDAARRASGDYVVSEIGQHHRVWSRVSYETNRQGRVWARTNAYTELATGMHYRNDRGEWTESVPGFDLEPGWAVARRGAHQVALAADARTHGGVDIRTPDNQRLRSHVLGLSYLDTASGQAVLIAETTNCVGQLLPSGNEVLYANAFTDFRADLLYTCTKAGFRQDVILREQPPGPELFGLNPQTTRLQVLTEFVEAPEPVKQTVGGESMSTNRAAMEVEPTDTMLDFGTMQMGRGLAFLAGEATRRRVATPVSKSWVVMEGRRCLVEEVRWPAMAPRLRALPQAEAYRIGAKDTNLLAQRCVPWEHLLPAGPETRKSTGMLAWAAAAPAAPGYVVDYELYGSLANFTLRGDTTYHVTDTVYLTGCVTIEGGTVVKSETSDCGSVVLYSDNIRCQTGPYRPAVFTSVNDDTIGMTINGSTGNPSSADVAEAIVFWGSSPGVLHDLRVRYAGLAINPISGWGATPFRFTHLQITHCFAGILVAGTAYLGNVLFYDIEDTAVYFSDPNSVVVAEHLTARNPSGTVPLWWGEDLCNEEFEPSFRLRNSLLCGFTVNCGADLHFTESVAANAFHQTVGAGAHYLAEESIYRDAGTTGIDAGLRAELRKKTTFPPIVHINQTWSSDVTLAPRNIQDDDDDPDLGYHYDVLDYAVGRIKMEGATLELEPGTAIACFLDDSDWGAIVLQCDAALLSHGTPTALNRVVWFNTVQEQAVSAWNAPEFRSSIAYGDPTCGSVTVDCRFTEFARLADAGDHIGMGDVGAPGGGIVLRDCLLRGGNLYCWAVDRMSPLAVNVNNCLFARANLYCYTYSQELLLEARNNLFWSNSISLDPYLPNATFLLRDNFFAGTALYQNGNAQPTHSHNAYYQGAARLTPNGSGDVLLTSPFVFQTGPLGDYYQGSTDLINQGSRSAIEAGLACATTRTDHQPDEGLVDIGLHYRLGGTLTAEPIYVEAYCASTAIDLSEGVQGCAYGYEIATPPEHGTLSGTPPTVTYLRPENYTGGDGFTYRATDGVMEVEVSVSIWTQNQPPTADGSTIPVCKEPQTVITLRGSDPCDEPLTFDIVTEPNDGELGPIIRVNNTTANVTYTPDTGFTGWDLFSFTVSDGVNDPVPATVWLDVNRPNPICQSLLMPMNTLAQPASVEILLRADRACNAPFEFDIAGGPSYGQLGTITPVGGSSARVTYTPAEDFEGTDSFYFVLKDEEWESLAAEVTVHIVSAPTLVAECREDRIVLFWTIPQWVEQADFADDFQIYRCASSSGDCTPSTPHATLSANSRAYMDTAVSTGMNYCYKIGFRHWDRCDSSIVFESPLSDRSCAQICPPPPPTNCVIRSGFNSEFLVRNDDNEGVNNLLATLPFPINFYGTPYSQLYVNNNGNVTFESGLPDYVPQPLAALQRNIIAPFWADVDTRNMDSDVVRYGPGTVGQRTAFGVVWGDVGYFATHADKLVSVQLVLIDRSDTGSGNFDMEFNYCNLRWEAGDASGGSEGFWLGQSGSSARAGFASDISSSFEFIGSGQAGAFLDSNLTTGLIHHSFNSNDAGRYVFQFRGGAPLQTP